MSVIRSDNCVVSVQCLIYPAAFSTELCQCFVISHQPQQFTGVIIMKRLILYIFTWIIISGMVTSDANLDKVNHVGCYYPDHVSQRKMEGITINACLNYCCKKRTTYAGVQQSDEYCFCGEDIIERADKKNDSLCDHRCNGKDNMFCGSGWLMSLYDISGACESPCTQSSDVSPVRFLVATRTGVKLYQKECSPEFSLLHSSKDWVHTVDYHFAKNLLFFVEHGILYKKTFPPVSIYSAADSVQPIKNMLQWGKGFAVDWVSDRIYWADCKNNKIMVTDLDGKGDTVILNRTEELKIKRMEVDPYKGMLFWITNGVIESCQLGDDTNFQSNVSSAGVSVQTLTLDMATHRVYYVGDVDGKVSFFTMNYQGGDQRELFSMKQMSNLFGLGLVNGNVYWANYNSSMDVLYKTTLTDPKGLQVSAELEKYIWHMRVVHPSLQQRPKITHFRCEDQLCSHGCVAESPTTVTCQCPDHHILDKDGITCTGMVTSDSPLDKVNHVGCYFNAFKGLDNVLHYSHHVIENITVDACVNVCCEGDSIYAGVEQSENSCYCGIQILDDVNLMDDSYCNDNCRGKDNMLCGGRGHMSMYEMAAACRNSCKPPNNDVRRVHFIVAPRTGLRLYQEECTKNFYRLQTIDERISTVDYHYAKQLVYFFANKRLFKTTFQPMSRRTAVGRLLPIRDVTHCEGFAVDWVSDRIYWADCNNNTIKSMDLDGSGDTVILNTPEKLGNIKRMEVDPYRGVLFWINEDTIESCQLRDVTKFQTNISRTGVSVRSLTLDMAARRVYYLGVVNGSASLFSMNYQGGDHREFFNTTELYGLYGVGLLNGNVYWVNVVSLKEFLYKSSLTQPESQQKLVDIGLGEYVRHMRLVHPSVQKRPKVTTDPCEDKLCSHGCVAESPTTATCQ